MKFPPKVYPFYMTTINHHSNMKHVIFVSLLLLSLSASAQYTLDQLVSKGIKLHDEGKYDEAIVVYEEALKMEKNSSLVNYEMGYTYFAMKDYKSSIKHLKKVIKANGDHLMQAYTIIGSAYDDMGKPAKAIKTYEEAIKDYPDHYLLHYNLGLTLYRQGELDEAEKSLINAIKLNAGHKTSNYLLGIIKAEQNRRVESLLSLYFFLLLEPDTDRAKGAYATIQKLMGKGVKRTGEKSIQLNVSLGGDDDEFSAANLMISLLAAGNESEENKNKSEQQLFYENTESIFGVLNETGEDKPSFWRETYIDFFSALKEAGHMEAFCYYISQTQGEDVHKWIEENEDKLTAFAEWVEE